MNYSDYIKTYEDLAQQVGGIVLANDITIRNLDLINGDLGVGDEIFQFYIISNPDFLLEHTDELVFYDDELHIYVWGITHFGKAWSSSTQGSCPSTSGVAWPTTPRTPSTTGTGCGDTAWKMRSIT